MRQNNFFISRIRHNKTLNYIALILLWVLTITSLPGLADKSKSDNNHIQYITPVSTIPDVSPSNFRTIDNDFNGYIAAVINEVVNDSLFGFYATIKFLSENYTQHFLSTLIFTLISSSFL